MVIKMALNMRMELEIFLLKRWKLINHQFIIISMKMI
jgi:hypothetical protein